MCLAVKLVLTQSSSNQTVCCRSCGNKQRIWDILYCLVLGWWGLPWGLIFTPVQIYRNIIGMIWPPDPSVPSEELASAVKADLAEQYIQSKQAEQQAVEE